MNEEEKQAIEFLRFYISDNEDEYFDKDYYIDKNIIETILNLIDKQQKEIGKRLKEIDSLYKMMSAKDERIEGLTELVNNYNDMQYIRKIEEKYISKDKIIEKIKKLETSDILGDYIGIQYLKELLGE